jgi:hypothetical protein
MRSHLLRQLFDLGQEIQQYPGPSAPLSNFRYAQMYARALLAVFLTIDSVRILLPKHSLTKLQTFLKSFFRASSCRRYLCLNGPVVLHTLSGYWRDISGVLNHNSKGLSQFLQQVFS